MRESSGATTVSIVGTVVASILVGFLLRDLYPENATVGVVILGSVTAIAGLIRIGYAVYDAGRRSADKEEK